MHVLLQVRDKQRAQRVLRAQTEQEISEVVAAEPAIVAVAAIQRVYIHHFREDALILVADLQRVSTDDMGIVHFRVKDRRILPLRFRSLASKVLVSSDQLCGKAARDARIRREPWNSVQFERIRFTESRWILSGLGPRHSKTQLKHLRGARHPVHSGRELLIEDSRKRVAAAARRRRQRGRIENVGLQLSEPKKSVEFRRELVIEFGVEFVIKVFEALRNLIIIGRRSGRIRRRCGRGEVCQHLACERLDIGGWNWNARWVRFPGERIRNRNGQNALPLGERWYRQKRRNVSNLSETLIVHKEKSPVFDDWSAERTAEIGRASCRER